MYNYMGFRYLRNYNRFHILTNYKQRSVCNYGQATYRTLAYRRSLYLKNDVRKHDYLLIRHISINKQLWNKEPLKASSKVEKTVQLIKDKKETETAVEPVTKRKSLGKRVWEELVHYYHGFRLLFMDIRVSSHLVWRLLNGKSLTRREHNLLIRTVGDMFRLVPFSVFIIIPFMEFALPLYLKFFPSALPSTFQHTSDVEENMKKTLKMKIEMAKFLQKTLDEMAVQSVDRNSKSAKEFHEWFKKVRTSGKEVTNEEIMKFSKLFKDEITLDSLSRGQLVALCRVLEVQTLGPNNILRFQLRMKLRSLAADDKLIQKEGIDSLNVYELQQACRARGMGALGLSEQKLKLQLEQWLDLSLNQRVPPSLLLLSRALMLPERIPTEDKLKATISVLPETAAKRSAADIAEIEGKIDNKVKYEIVKEEIRKVKEERCEREEQKRKDKEKLIDTAPTIMAKESEELVEPKKINTKDLAVLEEAIDHLGQSKQQIILEKEKIKNIKEELADYQEDLNELKEVTVETGAKTDLKISKAAHRLYNRVNKMINKLDTVVSQLEKKEQALKKEIETTPEAVKAEEVVKIDELILSIRKLKKVPNESVIKQIEFILSKMDDDHDGSVKVDDVLKVIQLIGKENVNLSSKQLDEIIDLVDKEEILEVEDKIEKALQKDKEQEILKASEKASDEKKKNEQDVPKITDEKKKNDDSKTETSTVTDITKLSCQTSASKCTTITQTKSDNIPTIPPVSINQTKEKDKPNQL